MKSRYGCLTLIVLAVIIGLAIGMGGSDINSTKDVIERMQGSWTGYDHEGGIYTHYKLAINGNSFKGWMQSTYTDDTPNFASSPDVIGTYTLSPVQGYTNSSGKYRNINFTMEGGGFGNNSLSARSFTNMIVYDDSNGLYVVGWGGMSREGGTGTWQGWVITIGLILAFFFEIKARLFGEGKASTEPEIEATDVVQENKPITGAKVDSAKPSFVKDSSQSIGDLHKAKELLDSGLISAEEFTEIKRQILGSKTSDERKTNIKQEPLIEKTKKTFNKKPLIISAVAVAIIFIIIFLYRSWLIQIEEDNSNFKFNENSVTLPDKDKTETSDSVIKEDNQQAGDEEALADSYYEGFLSTPTGERYKKINIQVPNHDEVNTTSEIEVTTPVEGFYVSSKDGKTRLIKISYDGEKIYVLHWVDSEQPIKVEAYITSKGYFSFGSEEFDYDRYGETVDEVQNLTLVERFSGEIFSWSVEKNN